MAEVLLVFDDRLAGSDGATYGARVCGRPTADGRWEGWIEFTPSTETSGATETGGAARALRTSRETLQPTRRDLVYWATGLTHTFLDGALARALGVGLREPLARGPGPGRPARPQPGRPAARREREVTPGRIAAHEEPLPAHAVLDPFEVWMQGEELLRGELEALAPMHLRAIVRAFALSERPPGELAELDAAALRREIVTGVRRRLNPESGARGRTSDDHARP